MRRLAEADAILICVPTPLTESRDPDLSYIEATARQIAAVLRPGQLIVLESTTYPGTTRDVVLPILAAGGLKVGEDFFLAYSPEREDPGNPNYTASGIPKVVGGIEPRSAELAEALYGQAVVQIVPVANCEVAEACKILENTYRSVNIAMVNELKMLFDRIGIDVWEVIDAAKTKPFGFQAFYPGPGLGGHCIPIDPFYLSWVARKHGLTTRFIELAGEINTSMPHYVIQRVIEALNDAGKPVAREQDLHPGRGLQERRRRPARKPFVRADGTADGARGGGQLQRSARAEPAADAASSGVENGESALGACLFGGAGLRADRHRPFGVRLRFHCAAFTTDHRHPQCHEGSSRGSGKNSQGITSQARFGCRLSCVKRRGEKHVRSDYV